MQLDYIIVGQGIAGSLVSYFLLKENKKVLVIDKFDPCSSSNISAGIINPVTGKKTTKTWRADELIPFAKEVYKDIEKDFGQTFFYKKKIIKLFTSEKEVKDWNKVLESNDEEKYVKELKKTKKYRPFINIGPGGVVLKKGGYLDIRSLIFSFRRMLREMGLLLEEDFEYGDFEIYDDHIQYKDWSAKKIIFCEGYKAVNNPYFKWLPFACTKGEIIEIESEYLPEERIINKHYWILPLGNHRFKIGATYNWDDLDAVPTDEAKNIILEKLQKIIKVPFEVKDHYAGVRPTVKDRKPLIGTHPEYPSLAVFNGMGSKGASLTPFFANQLIQHLEYNGEIDEEVDIRRAWKKEKI